LIGCWRRCNTEDLFLVAKDDELRRRLQDAKLTVYKRASKRYI